ncbi:MAG: hypothetical protein H6732_19725 [Alphaproteobacteria bacterium]|nr:hypothetical protein [Alphaproteobacteria bacterium]
MTRLTPLLLLAACGPLPEEFADVYTDRWCATWVDQCGTTEPDHCRDEGRETSALPPKVDCDYRSEAARVCVEPAGWRCEDEVVTPPAVCARVWSCPASP